jgi:pimeloyl-ACP methyl ester carboxylesterase
VAALHARDGGPKPETVITDTASYSDIVCGLFAICGYRFSRRIADTSDARLWRVNTAGGHGPLQQVSWPTIRLDRIRAHRGDMLRAAGAGSLSTGEIRGGTAPGRRRRTRRIPRVIPATCVTTRVSCNVSDMKTSEKIPTLVFVPCFSGAPWSAEQLAPYGDAPKRTLRLPEGVDDMERYADHAEKVVADLDDWVLVGDSFGANITLALATRRPKGLRALVLSGGFAANPVDSKPWKALMRVIGKARGPLYT